MAQTLKRNLSVTIGNIVSGAITSALAVKSLATSKKEADFQALVAEGSMTYEAQIAYRKTQLAEEMDSSIPDPSFISTLKTSIANVTKLNRFSKYRATYQKSLADFKSGIETAQQHLDILTSQLNMTTDPDLQAEIQTEITAAKADVKASNDAILTNEVTRATKDGTLPTLNQAIADVNTRRAQAKLAGNDEAVSAYDVTLTNLKSQVGTVQIQDTMTNLEITGLTKNLSANEKLTALATQLNSADGDSPVTVGSKKYSSSKDYWNSVMGSYLSGTGTGLFSNFFTELSNTYTNKINGAVARDGFATSITLDGIKTDFKNLRANPAMQPYLNQLGDMESQALGVAIKTTAQHILDTASYTQDFKSADNTLAQYGQTYGVDVNQYRLKLADDINKQALAATSGDVGAASKIVKSTGVKGITTPQSEFPVTTQTDLTQHYGLQGTTVYDKNTNLPLTEEQFKKQTGISNLDWSKIKLDTAYKPPVAPTAPAAPATPDNSSTPAATPAPTPTATPTPTPSPTPAPAPAPTPAPTPTPAPAAPVATPKYSGSSIVDFLKQSGQDTSFTSRKALAEKNGIQNYQGSAEQNLGLLKILNK